ncbi:hypothetical protein [Halomicroarcula sp. GCM10025743]|uniref:hypothetical protein n=1 Tax=Halomicroarcula sp. GCM10025743 TaxID=3252671 RepID=UPI0036D3CD00
MTSITGVQHEMPDNGPSCRCVVPIEEVKQLLDVPILLLGFEIVVDIEAMRAPSQFEIQ